MFSDDERKEMQSAKDFYILCNSILSSIEFKMDHPDMEYMLYAGLDTIFLLTPLKKHLEILLKKISSLIMSEFEIEQSALAELEEEFDTSEALESLKEVDFVGMYQNLLDDKKAGSISEERFEYLKELLEEDFMLRFDMALERLKDVYEAWYEFNSPGGGAEQIYITLYKKFSEKKPVTEIWDGMEEYLNNFSFLTDDEEDDLIEKITGDL